MVAFAANSVICRLALGAEMIDAKSFTITRLLSGAITLALITALRGRTVHAFRAGNRISAIALFFYAAGFSFSYQSLDTGTGAIILFASVQITMIVFSVLKRDYPHKFEWLGIAMAVGGFIYLVYPGVSTPALSGFVLMVLAGFSWAIYTLRGRMTANALDATTGNFLLTVPLTALLYWFMGGDALRISSSGIILAVLSGSLASAVGYAIWYSVLPGLSVTEAAVVQLSAPVLATLGGIVFMSEALTVRFSISTLLILGGILAVVFGRQSRKK